MPPDPEADAAAWYAAFDTLRLEQPQEAAALAGSFPDFADEILGRRVFGFSGEPARKRKDRRALGVAAIETVCAAITRSLDNTLKVARRRSRRLARIRLGAGMVALLSSAGVVAALSRNASIPVTAVSATVATAAAALNLLATYYEEQAGGAGSLGNLNEMLSEQAGALAEIQGRIGLGLPVRGDNSPISIMTSLNTISRRLQTARARLGLPLSDLPT